MHNIFDPKVVDLLFARLDKLAPSTQALWGKMAVGQMLAHCNVTYEMVLEDKHPMPKGIMKWILKVFVKKIVVSEKPYKHGSQTAPAFIMKDPKNFEVEKSRLKTYVLKTLELGENYFDGRQSHSFGVLTKQEWNNMLYKHLDHHFKQFGV